MMHRVTHMLSSIPAMFVTLGLTAYWLYVDPKVWYDALLAGGAMLLAQAIHRVGEPRDVAPGTRNWTRLFMGPMQMIRWLAVRLTQMLNPSIEPAMKIKNHMLDDPKVDTSLQSPNKGGQINPTIIVLHYTASGGEDGSGDASYLSRASSRASAHVVVGRNGSIDQIVPFNRRAWHAGKSSYNGRDDVNDFSIGIEIDNHGWLDGADRPKLPESLIFHGKRGPYTKWEKYRDEQLEAVEEVIASIVAKYPITDIVGHEDIAPGRKTDPGPALDDFMAKMKAKYLNAEEGKASSKPKQSSSKKRASDERVTTANLNLRKRPTTSGVILTTIPKGATVKVLSEWKGWSEVRYGNRQAYVSSQYLS